MVDVYGLDSESLAWLSRPVLSVILLFPCTDQYYEYRDKQAAEIKASGQTISPDVFYMKQIVPNACGTVALIHSVANSNDAIQLGDGHLKLFLDDCKTMSPEERGDHLQKADNIINAHKEIAQEGQTEVRTYTYLRTSHTYIHTSRIHIHTCITHTYTYIHTSHTLIHTYITHIYTCNYSLFYILSVVMINIYNNRDCLNTEMVW